MIQSLSTTESANFTQRNRRLFQHNRPLANLDHFRIDVRFQGAERTEGGQAPTSAFDPGPDTGLIIV